MRLVRLEAPGEGAPIDFHPALTVLGGLDEDGRALVREALQALPAGRAPGLAALIEAHGVLFDVDRENLRLLGLQSDVDVVVGRDDLQAASADGPATHAAADQPAPPRVERDPVEELRLSHDILAHGVVALKRERLEFEDARLQAVEAIEEARADLDPFATTAFEQAAGQLRRAEDAGGDGAVEPEPVPAASIEDLEAEREQLRAALAETEEVDLEPVIEVLHQAERATGEEGLDPVAVRALARELAEAEDAVAGLERRRREEGRDPVDLLRRIEGARIQLERLEAAGTPPSFDPADVAELERAHDEVVEADSKVSASRIGGKAARQRLDDALAAEQDVLARMGFPTYSAYSLAQSAPGPDPETRVELETTRRELAELEDAHRRAQAGDDQDHERADLEARRDGLRADAAAVLGTAASDLQPAEVRPAIEALAAELESLDERHLAVEELRRALEERGIDFGDLELADDDIVDVARVWVADMQAMVDERARLERELDTVEARLLVVAPALAGAGHDPVAQAQVEVEAAEARLARHRQASDRVAELCGLLEQIEARLADLGENIDAQEALVAAAADGLAAAEANELSEEPASPLDEVLLPEGVDDTEWYLLTRLAAQSSLSFAGSVPLVLDGALEGLDREATRRVLDRIEQMTDVVQVVYLGEDDAVVAWAAERGARSAAVVSV